MRTIRWESTPRQTGAYGHALDTHRDEFDWIAFIDSDELMFSPRGSVKAVLAEQPQDRSALAVHWIMFGSSGATTISRDRLMIEQFQRHGPLALSTHRHIKSIVRPERAIGAINAHIFTMADDDPYHAADGTLVADWVKPGKAADIHVPAFDRLRCHHYFTRSREHYDRKLARGAARVGKPLRDRFAKYDRNDEHDDSAMMHHAEVVRLMKLVSPAA